MAFPEVVLDLKRDRCGLLYRSFVHGGNREYTKTALTAILSPLPGEEVSYDFDIGDEPTTRRSWTSSGWKVPMNLRKRRRRTERQESVLLLMLRGARRWQSATFGANWFKARRRGDKVPASRLLSVGYGVNTPPKEI